MPTVIPLTPETDWLDRLRGVRIWEPPLTTTLVLSPHPDDETLGCGGLIAWLTGQSIPVTVAAITDGEGAYAGTPGLGELRVHEQVEALDRLGVPQASIHRLQVPDTKVASFEDDLVHRLLPLASQAGHLVAPWPLDVHPDHEATGRAAQRVASKLGVELTFYLFWTWHRRTPDFLDSVDLVMLPLNEQDRAAKLYALEAHRSQFQHPDGQPILSPDLIKPARRAFEIYIR